MVHIMGDGNCLFRALSLLVYGSEDAHGVVRELLVNFISSNKAKFQHLMDLPFEDHIARMKNLRVWGTAVELQASASLFQIPVYTLQPAQRVDRKYRWCCYKPQDDSTLLFPSEPPPKGLIELDHLELFNAHACHYDCIMTIEDRTSPLDRPHLHHTVS